MDYNLEQLKKKRPIEWDDGMEILTKPKSFLSTVTVIDLDTQLPNMHNNKLGILQII